MGKIILRAQMRVRDILMHGAIAGLLLNFSFSFQSVVFLALAIAAALRCRMTFCTYRLYQYL